MVREARQHRQDEESAWKNEALRFWYLVVRRNRNINLRKERRADESLLVDQSGQPFEMQPLMQDVHDV